MTTHHAHVNVWFRGTLIPAISEHSPDFNPSIVDHENLADMIGKTVVRAINHSRTQGLPVEDCRFGVDIRRT